MARTLQTLLLVLTLALPAAGAKEIGIRDLKDDATPATLYFHLIDFQDFPINTQSPDDRYTQGTAVSVTGTMDCAPDTRPHYNSQQQFHTFYGFSSPSYVEYLFEQGDSVRTHPERGISYDARMDAAAPFTVYWYVTTQSTPLGPVDGAEPDTVPMVVPNLVVEARMRAGDGISLDDVGYNEGPTIAHGRSQPATLVADQALGDDGQAAADVTALGLQPDGKWLYEVAVPMGIEIDTIPRATGYNLRVDVSVDNPACDDQTGEDALMPNVIEMHTSPGHRPRMELSVHEAVRIDSIHPQFIGDDLVIHTSMNAVWGNYDVAEVSVYTPDVTADDLRLDIDGPTPAPGLERAAMVMETHGHNKHQDAVAVSYVWPYKEVDAKAGSYTVTLTVRNDQRTAEASGTTTFEIGKSTTACGVGAGVEDQCTSGTPAVEPGNNASGAGAPLAILAAALGLALRRRA